jgi:broad specificity phosphatase PhoE
METEIFLIRHAITHWHGESRVLGQNDIPLDDAGIAQAQALAQALVRVPFARIISSPLKRALQTASLLGEATHRQVTPDPRLTDMRVGEWEGMTYADLAKREDYRALIADPSMATIPGGETFEAARNRALDAVSEAHDASGGPLAVVTHCDIVRLLLCHYLNIDLAMCLRFRVAVASVSTVFVHGNQSKVLGVNWTPVLEDAVFPAVR